MYVITNYLHFCLQVSMTTYFHLSFLKLLLAITRLLIRIFRILFYFFGQKKFKVGISLSLFTFLKFCWDITSQQCQYRHCLSVNSHFDSAVLISRSQSASVQEQDSGIRILRQKIKTTIEKLEEKSREIVVHKKS